MKLQAKHVPEDVVLALLSSQPVIDAQSGARRWMTHWDGDNPEWNMPAAAPALRAFPEKVLRAKLNSMLRRGLVDGCGCGCRGDWHIPYD